VSSADQQRDDTRQGSHPQTGDPTSSPKTHITKYKMAVLSFSLTPEATGRIYEALVCLAKFGELVAIEARGDKVRLGIGLSISTRFH
jgi:hypothetical protein